MFLTLMHVALTSCCENSWSRAFFSDSPNVSQVAHKAINVYLSRLQKSWSQNSSSSKIVERGPKLNDGKRK